MLLEIVTTSSDCGRGREASAHSICRSGEPKEDLQFSAGPPPLPTALQPGPGWATQGCMCSRNLHCLFCALGGREWPAQLQDPDTALGKFGEIAPSGLSLQ